MRIRAIVVVLMCSSAVTAQQSQQWKEYQYPDDGFAVTLPYAPKPHKDQGDKDINVYTVQLEKNTMLSLRAVNRAMDCNDSLKKLRSGSFYGPQWSIVSGSLKETTIAGYPGLEYESVSQTQHVRYLERYYCVNGRFYTLTASASSNETRPPSVDRIFSSFRLLEPTNK